MTSVDTYPDVVIQEIAKRLDYSTMQAMKLVNKRFLSAVSDPLLWMDLCERDHRTLPTREFRKGLADHALSDESCKGKLDFERIWVKDPFRSNLAPPILSTLEEMQRKYGWKFEPDGEYSSVIVEEPPVGAEPHPEITRCFATSFWIGLRELTIDLVKEGVPEWLLDHVRPRIVINELAAPRWDCASEYQMLSKLLRADENFSKRVPAQLFRDERREWPQWTDPARWEKVEVAFDGYPAGMRKVAVISQGVDRQFWRGHYGAKFANLQIRLEMPDEFRCSA